MNPATSNSPVRVVVSDETKMGCELLGQALKRSRHNLTILACTASINGLIENTQTHHPDVVLVSLQLEDGANAGLLALAEIHARHPDVALIFMMNSANGKLAIDAFRAGAKGVFYRTTSFDLLCRCIRSVYQGQVWCGSAEMQQMLQALSVAVPVTLVSATGDELLTRRQQELVSLVTEGLTNREIARRLHLSEHTVKNYLFRIFDKLGVSNRAELIIYTLEQGKKAS